jgi:hypothetical protein
MQQLRQYRHLIPEADRFSTSAEIECRRSPEVKPTTPSLEIFFWLNGLFCILCPQQCLRHLEIVIMVLIRW